MKHLELVIRQLQLEENRFEGAVDVDKLNETLICEREREREIEISLTEDRACYKYITAS